MKSRKEGRCSVYYDKKNRFCRQEVSLTLPPELSDSNFQPLYCGNHYHLYSNHIQTYDQDHKRYKIAHGINGTRIPCPVDPSHTIYEHKLTSHLKKCNKTRNENEIRAQNFYEHGINTGGYGIMHTLDDNKQIQDDLIDSVDVNQLARQILIAFQRTFTPKSMKPVESLTQEDIYEAIDTRDFHKNEMELGLENVPSKYQVKIGGQKHLVQIGSIIGHCRKSGLLVANTVLEMGAGRATTGFMVSSVCAKHKHVKLVLVERGGSRSKADTAIRRKKEDDISSNKSPSECYLNTENVELHRIKCDLAHVNVSTVLKDIEDDRLTLCQEVNLSDKASRDVLLVAKHLCGAGTDLALKSVFPIRERINGCVLATCCHGVCNWSDYVGRKFLNKVMTSHESNVFGHAEFEVLRKWSCGTVTGSGTSKDDHSVTSGPEDDDPVGSYLSLTKVLKTNNFQCGSKGMGRACQRLIDYGRSEFMREMLFHGQEVDTGISHYVDDNITPQNALLFASIK